MSKTEDTISTSSTSFQATYQKPKFVEALQSTYEVDEKTSILFKCITAGVPIPEVQWYLNDQLISDDR